MIPILYMTTGAVLALGLFHVFLAMKGLHKRAHLAFFITCLAGVVYALLSIKVFESVSVAEYMSYVRIRMFAFGVLFPALAWFIAFYTGVVHRPALTTLTVIWLATPLVRMIDPSTTLVYGEIRGLRNIQVFTGEHLALLDADVSLFGIGLYLLIFGIYGHIIYTAWRLHQAGHKYYTGLLILSLLAFFGSVVHDIAQEAFQLPTPPLGEFGFLFVIGFMSLGVAEEVLQVNTVKAKLWEANRDRNTASRARQATEARLRLLIDSMSDVVWLSSDDGTLFLASPSVASTFGFTLSRYLTLSLEERVAPEDLPKLREALAAIAHRGGASGVVTQIRYLRQDGSQVLCEVTLSQVPAHDGVDRGVLSIIRDITARVEIEDRLRQSEKAQVIGQLAGGVAHDFNNQLAGILGFAELLRDDLEDRPEQREDAIRIIRSAER
ncbi:MAG: PAS domain S-box protein, partial [Deltaproteobacteria bacterium]|nr:PAS domain S-box protein [Deltaproteobacteria bacterium]